MARTGQEYIEALKANPPNLWLKGEKIGDPTEHSSPCGVVEPPAQMHNVQHCPEYNDALTDALPMLEKPVRASLRRGPGRSSETLRRLRS
jgi:4-hydroxyphenylacetate 3-monooxygenase